MCRASRPRITLIRRVYISVGTLLLLAGQAFGQEHYTPLAGEEYHTTILGNHVDVPPRDRRSVTAINFGAQWIPNGPSQLELLPFGSVFLWRNWDDGHRRFRGVIAGAFNDINVNIGSKHLKGLELLLTLDNIIIPFGRSEYVEGQRISDVEVEWNQVYGGIGLAYRVPLLPNHQDSALEVSLTYEPGYLWFRRSSNTSNRFVVPNDTFEHRAHIRLRVDALDRNLMELPHRGVALGGDLILGQRSRWGNWGGVAFDNPDFTQERDYIKASVYAALAGGVPFMESEEHRLVTTLYAGIGDDLDRFSAFRLPGRPTGFEWEALSLPVMPGVAFNELLPRRYGIANLIYRYEAMVFLYPYLEATWGLVERPRFSPGGRIENKMDSLPALGGGLISGAPWNSQVEINYSYNFGMIRDPGGARQFGSHGMFVFWSKELK